VGIPKVINNMGLLLVIQKYIFNQKKKV